MTCALCGYELTPGEEVAEINGAFVHPVCAPKAKVTRPPPAPMFPQDVEVRIFDAYTGEEIGRFKPLKGSLQVEIDCVNGTGVLKWGLP